MIYLILSQNVYAKLYKNYPPSYFQIMNRSIRCDTEAMTAACNYHKN